MTSIKDKRIWYSVIGVLLALLAVTRAVDDVGTQHTEEALVRALATFGIARALNGVISVAQGTEVAIEPAGVGVILTPGQILDPINDLIERFSWVMLVSSASLGVLNILLAMSVWQWFNLALLICLFAALIMIWFRRLEGQWITRFVVKLAMVLLVLRFTAPVVAIANDLIYEHFLAQRYDTAISQLEQATGRVEAINQQVQQQQVEQLPVERSLLDKARDLVISVRESMDFEARIAEYEQAVSEVSRHAIELIVIFTLQTILLPVLFIWVAWQLIKTMVFRGYGGREI